MMQLIRSVDDRISRATTEAYLFLFDRTGMYLATVDFIISMAAIAFTFYSSNRWFAVIMVAICGASCCLLYFFQTAASTAHFNTLQLIKRSSTAYRLAMIAWVAFVVEDTFNAQFLAVFGDILFLASCYVDTALIRDREPKDWITSKSGFGFAQ